MDNLNIKNIKNVSLSVTELGGINKRKSGSGSLYSALNMTADHLPFLKQRGRRAVIRRLSSPHGLCGGDTLIYADGGRLYFGGDEIEGIYLSEGEKTLLRVGKYLVVMPDRVYYNLDDPSDFGQMNVSRTASYARICCVDKELSELDYTARSRSSSRSS